MVSNEKDELKNEQLDKVTGGNITISSDSSGSGLFDIGGGNSDPFEGTKCTYDMGRDLNGDYPSCSDVNNKGLKPECRNCPA